MPIQPDSVRCSSLDGFRLPGGADVNTHLRQEVPTAKAFVGLVSPSSLRSAYVAFELGARWGSGRELIPLLAPGIGSEVLSPPLSGLNALSCSSPAQLHQLVGHVARLLDVSPYSPMSYQRKIEHVCSLPPVSGEPTVPPYLADVLRLDWLTRRERLIDSHQAMLAYIESESSRRASVPQQDVESEFKARYGSVYWRLESLCYLGFIEKEVTNYRGRTPTYNYRLSPEYQSSLKCRGQRT